MTDSLDTNLEAAPRTVRGKKVKILRREGIVPANVYGNKGDSLAIQLPERMVTQRVLRASRSSLFTLRVDGGASEAVLVKELQRHPTTGQVLHLDLFRVAMDQKLRVAVPLHLVGEAPAARETGGMLLQSLASVEVEALPGDLPSSFEVDVSVLDSLDAAVHVGDLKAPPGVEILGDSSELIATVVPPTVERVAEEAPVEAEGVGPVEAEAAAQPTSQAERTE